MLSSFATAAPRGDTVALRDSASPPKPPPSTPPSPPPRAGGAVVTREKGASEQPAPSTALKERMQPRESSERLFAVAPSQRMAFVAVTWLSTVTSSQRMQSVSTAPSPILQLRPTMQRSSRAPADTEQPRERTHSSPMKASRLTRARGSR